MHGWYEHINRTRSFVQIIPEQMEGGDDNEVAKLSQRDARHLILSTPHMTSSCPSHWWSSSTRMLLSREHPTHDYFEMHENDCDCGQPKFGFLLAIHIKWHVYLIVNFRWKSVIAFISIASLCRAQMKVIAKWPPLLDIPTSNHIFTLFNGKLAEFLLPSHFSIGLTANTTM